MVAVPASHAIEDLPRLRAALADVLGLAPWNAHLDPDRADALAGDDAGRAEVRTTFDRHSGIGLAEDEVEARGSLADPVRLVAARQPAPPHADA